MKIHDSIDSKGEKQFEKFNKNQFEIRSIRLHLYFNDCQINGCSFFSSRRIQGGSSDSSTQFFSNEVIWPGMRIFSIIEHQQGKGNLLLFRGQNSSLLADDGTTVLSAVNGKTIRIAFFKAATASYNCFNFRVSNLLLCLLPLCCSICKRNYVWMQIEEWILASSELQWSKNENGFLHLKESFNFAWFEIVKLRLDYFWFYLHLSITMSILG